MPNYTRLAATAKRLVEKNARSVTLFKAGRTPANASEPWKGPSTSVDPSGANAGATVTVLAAFVPKSGTDLGSASRDRLRDSVKDRTKIALIATTSLPADTDLSQFDSIRDGNDVWRIVGTDELKPSTTSLLWEIEVTK